MKEIEEVYTIIENLSTIDNPHPILLETYGKDLEIVLNHVKKNNKKVWTVMDDDDGNIIVFANYHLVNRIGYLISKEEWKDETECYIY